MNFFKRLFLGKQSNIKEVGLISLKSFINMPDKNFYRDKDNKEKLKQYVNEYKEMLSSDKTILSVHLSKLECDDVRVYIDIIASLEIYFNNILDVLNNMEERNTTFTQLLLSKLKGYSMILKSIEEESFLRIRALNEVLKNPFLGIQKRDAINCEISRLEVQIFNVQNNNKAIHLQINSFLDASSSSNLKDLQDKDSYLKEIWERLKKYLFVFYIDFKDEFSIENLVTSSIKLEKKLFSDKNVLDKLKERFSKLKSDDSLWDNDSDSFEDDELRKSNLFEINFLITKYMAIKEYKRVSDDEFFYELVKYKFRVIEVSYNEYKDVLSDTLFQEEKEVMKYLLQERFTEFSKDKNKKILESYKRFEAYKAYTSEKKFVINDYERLVRQVSNLLKSNGEFDYDKVLSNPLFIGLLFSLKNPSKLWEFYHDFTVNEGESLNYYFPYFEWYDEISLMSYCRVLSLADDLIKPDNGIKELCDIYKEVVVGCFGFEGKEVELFDGLKKITNKSPTNNFQLIFKKRLLDKMKNYLLIGHMLILPKGLKSFDLEFFDSIFDYFITKKLYDLINCLQISFNSDLEELFYYGSDTKKITVDLLEISSSLKRLEIKSSRQVTTFDTIKFNEYYLSGLLRNKDAIKEIFTNTVDSSAKNNYSGYAFIGWKLNKLCFRSKNRLLNFDIEYSEFNGISDKFYEVFNRKASKCYKKLYELAMFCGIYYEEAEYSLENMEKLSNILSLKIPYNYSNLLEVNKSVLSVSTLHYIDLKIRYVNYLSDFGYSVKDCDKKDLYKEKFRLIYESDRIHFVTSDTPEEEVDIFRKYMEEYYYDFISKHSSKENREEEEIANLIFDICNSFYSDNFLVLLKNRFVFNLFKYSSNKEELYNFLKNYMINPYDSPNSYRAHLIIDYQMKDEVPLTSFLEIVNISSSTIKDKKDFLGLLVNLYNLVKPKCYQNYYVPEGCVSIDTSFDAVNDEDMKSKNIILPEGLRKFYYRSNKNKDRREFSFYNKGTVVSGIEINEELEYLDISGLNLKSVSIPKGVRTARLNSEVASVNFLDFEESNLLNNRESLREFLMFLLSSYIIYGMDNPTKVSVNNIILTSMNSSLVIVVPIFENVFYEFNKGDKILRDDEQIVFNQEEYKKTIKYYEKVSFEHLAEDVAIRIEKILRIKRSEDYTRKLINPV